MGDSISTVGDIFSTVEGVQYTGEITSLHVRDNIITVGDNISTVEDIQYSGGRILISACLAINNDAIFCITIRNFHSEVSKILADFMPFEIWTGVLQVQPYF